MKHLKIAFAACFGICLAVPSAQANGKLQFQWPHWRGPEMNGISREKNLPESWDPKGETLLWENDQLGSRSTPVVFNGKLYTIMRDQPSSDQEGEKVVCADAATGEIQWENRFNVYLSDVPDTRVGWSSVCVDPETGNVFALGVGDHFLCIDGETGKTLWSHPLSEEYGMLNTYGGRTNFPVVYGDLVIVSGVIIGWGEMAKPAHRFIAFDKRNGQPVWFEGTRLLPNDTTYSAPVLTVIDGQALMIFGSGDGGVHAFQPRTGKKVWTYNVSDRGINTAPVVVGDIVVCGHSEENTGSNKMGALFALDGSKTGEITPDNGLKWRNLEMFVGKSAPVVVDGRIYAIEDKGTLLVVDLENGKLIGSEKIGTQGRASLLYADGRLYVAEANGRLFIMQPDDEKGVKILERKRINDEINGSPIAAGGRIYLPGGRAMYCFGKADTEPESEPIPEPEAEKPVGDDEKPAHIQIVPVESLLYSGNKRQRQALSVRLYNANGQWLRTVKADEIEFDLEGVGDINKQGQYTAPKEAVHGAAIITAKVGDLTGQARARVVADLPWSFDFNDGTIPITWVGARYRHIPLDFDLFTHLRDVDPLAADAYILLTTDFINGGSDKVTYDNSTPRQLWTNFLRFFNLETEITTLDGAKEKFDPALDVLKQEKILAGWSWKELDGTGPQLVVERGERRIEGNGVMCKIRTIPLGTRSQGWMGPADFANHSIQADVYGFERDGKAPDIGLQSQRYRLTMFGEKQELELKSWIAHEIKYHTVPFEWKPETWYTMKLQTKVEQRDGKPVAVLHGKVWPRGEDEPADWQIEWTDSPGNEVGSPGLFGAAPNAEIFYDNIKVTKNE